MRISSETNKDIIKYYLLNSSPHEIYRVFEEYALSEKEKLPRNHNLLENCEIDLIAKGHPIINLALARYGFSEDVFKKLHSSADLAILVALFSNARISDWLGLSDWLNEFPSKDCFAAKIILGLITKASKDEFLDSSKQGLKKVFDLDKTEELKALFTNPYLNGEVIEKLYLKKGLFKELSDRQWRTLTYYTIQNPLISANYSSFEKYQSGEDYYYAILAAIDSLLFTVTVDMGWARVLLELLEKTKCSFFDISKIEVILNRWNVREEEKELNPNPESPYNRFYFDDYFRLRVYLSSNVKFDGIIFEQFKDSEDEAKRAGYYKNFSFSDSQFSLKIVAFPIKNDELEKNIIYLYPKKGELYFYNRWHYAFLGYKNEKIEGDLADFYCKYFHYHRSLFRRFKKNIKSNIEIDKKIQDEIIVLIFSCHMYSSLAGFIEQLYDKENNKELFLNYVIENKSLYSDELARKKFSKILREIESDETSSSYKFIENTDIADRFYDKCDKFDDQIYNKHAGMKKSEVKLLIR